MVGWLWSTKVSLLCSQWLTTIRMELINCQISKIGGIENFVCRIPFPFEEKIFLPWEFFTCYSSSMKNVFFYEDRPSSFVVVMLASVFHDLLDLIFLRLKKEKTLKHKLRTKNKWLLTSTFGLHNDSTCGYLKLIKIFLPTRFKSPSIDKEWWMNLQSNFSSNYTLDEGQGEIIDILTSWYHCCPCWVGVVVFSVTEDCVNIFKASNDFNKHVTDITSWSFHWAKSELEIIN